tara:strand:- start:198 stop:884 length:687 start_codon:yes stop_codon:yes gene_type:complete
MIDLINQVVYIHVPRTGGSNFCHEYYQRVLHHAVDKEIYKQYIVGHGTIHKHLIYAEYIEIYIGHDIDKFNQVCIIRNIYDLVVSTFFQTSERGTTFYTKWCSDNGMGISFESWIRYLEMLATIVPVRFQKNQWRSMLQSEYLAGCREECMVINYDNYSNGINKWFSDTCNIQTDIQRTPTPGLIKQYKSATYPIPRPTDYRDMYTDETKKSIDYLFREEIDIFEFMF